MTTPPNNETKCETMPWSVSEIREAVEHLREWRANSSLKRWFPFTDDLITQLRAAKEQAERERDAIQKDFDIIDEAADVATKSVERLTIERDEFKALYVARDAEVVRLKRYARHNTDCAFVGGYEYGCTCGLDALLNAGSMEGKG